MLRLSKGGASQIVRLISAHLLSRGSGGLPNRIENRTLLIASLGWLHRTRL